MRRGWGMVWLAAALLTVSLMGGHLPATAAEADVWRAAAPRPLPLLLAAQTPLQAQMLGEKPFKAQSPQRLLDQALPEGAPGLALDEEGGATLRLPRHLELRISVLYNREPFGLLEPKRRSDSPLLFKYSMDYRLLANLRVGLSGYLYHAHADEGFSPKRPFGDQDRVMGLGPGIKYDLGRWSFVFKSQLETGHRDRGENLQNWFRIWYAF